MIRLVKLRRGTKARRFATLAALVPLLAASTTTQVFANSGPTASFAYSPSYPVAGQPVSFDGSVSTCEAGPCTYTWTDDAVTDKDIQLAHQIETVVDSGF